MTLSELGKGYVILKWRGNIINTFVEEKLSLTLSTDFHSVHETNTKSREI